MLAALEVETRWRRRLIRTVELMTAHHRYRRLRPTCELARSDDLPADRDLAVGFVADWFADQLLCHDGAARFIERIFELGADEARLMMAENCGVRAARGIAAEPKICPAVAQRLAISPSVEVRVCLAGNGSLPQQLLEQLFHDPDPRVRHRAEWNPVFERTFEMPSYTSTDIDHRSRHSLL